MKAKARKRADAPEWVDWFGDHPEPIRIDYRDTLTDHGEVGRAVAGFTLGRHGLKELGVERERPT